MAQIVAQWIDRIEALGVLSERSRHGLSRVISKNRRLTDHTLRLFLDSSVRDLRLYDCSNVTSDAFQSIAKQAPRTERLQLDYCGQLTSDALLSFLALPGLQRIDLYGAYLVRREAWLKFLEARGASLAGFRIRETPRFDSACIEALSRYGEQLDTVQLAQVGCLNDENVQFLTRLPRLRHLDLSQPGVSQPGVPPASLTDAGVVPVLQHHPNLLSLHLGKNAALSDATLDAIGPHVTHLVLDELAQADERAWTRLWQRCASLEHLSIRATNMSSKSLQTLAQSAKKLATLSVNSNDTLTTAGLRALVKHRVPLETLDVGFVRCVDDALLTELAAAIPTLSTLYVFGCPGVVRFAHPHVTVIGRERRA